MSDIKFFIPKGQTIPTVLSQERTVRIMTIEEKIARSEHFAKLCGQAEIPEWQEECEQLAAWLRILKKAKFEYDEAWRIITHPTPDVTYADRNRAQLILDTFRNSLGVMDDANNNLHV